jgi:uncharacterized protein
MIQRSILKLLKIRLREFPAAVLVGPRQAGKTTLARSLSSVYFDLEQPQDRLRLELEWNGLVKSAELVVLDEAQCWPEVFPKLRGAIDADRARKGRFLLLGSVAPVLMREVSESLAGRLAIVEITPLCALELDAAFHDALWRFGGFPDGGVLQSAAPSFPAWQNFFLTQMAQRDLPMWGLPAKPGVTERLMRLVAALNGSELNASRLGQNLGLSYHTVNSYLDLMEAAFLLRRIRPFEARNFAKRLVKTPKLYWRDAGLLHALLEHDPAASLFDQPWVGASWEGWVIEQIIAARSVQGVPFQVSYFRTNDGLECDLIVDTARFREVIEIKLTSSPTLADFAKLEAVATLVGAQRKVLISRTETPDRSPDGDRWSVNLPTYLARTGSSVAVTPSTATTIAADQNRRAMPTAAEIFARLKESEVPLVKRGVLTEQVLMRRAQGLSEDLKVLKIPGFVILPTRELADPASGGTFRLVEYEVGQTDHDVNRAEPGFNKDAKFIEGTGLSRESLAYFARVAEIGRQLLPELWLGAENLRAETANPNQHFNTLNEVWWLSRWHGVRPGTIRREYVFPGMRKPKGGTAGSVDWRVPVLEGAITLNIEVKNRRGTFASGVFKKGVYLFGDEPEKKFRVSGPDEINVLAITAYHSGAISEAEEAAAVAAYLDGTKAGQVVDAVALFVFGQGSAERLYFPTQRSLDRKDIILKSLKKPNDTEDHARIFVQTYPLPGTLEEIVARLAGSSPADSGR